MTCGGVAMRMTEKQMIIFIYAVCVAVTGISIAIKLCDGRAG